MAGIKVWRDIPVLEAMLRLTRTKRPLTAEAIADEALLHLGDVYDAIAAFVSLECIRIDTANDTSAPSDIAVVLNDGNFLLLRTDIMRSSSFE